MALNNIVERRRAFHKTLTNSFVGKISLTCVVWYTDTGDDILFRIRIHSYSRFRAVMAFRLFSLPASVRPCVNNELVRAITHHQIKLRSPYLDTKLFGLTLSQSQPYAQIMI